MCTCNFFETILYYLNKAKHYIIKLTSKSDGKMTGNSRGVVKPAYDKKITNKVLSTIVMISLDKN